MNQFDFLVFFLGAMGLGAILMYPIAFLKGRQHQVEKFGRKVQNAKAEI